MGVHGGVCWTAAGSQHAADWGVGWGALLDHSAADRWAAVDALRCPLGPSGAPVAAQDLPCSQMREVGDVIEASARLFRLPRNAQPASSEPKRSGGKTLARIRGIRLHNHEEQACNAHSANAHQY